MNDDSRLTDSNVGHIGSTKMDDDKVTIIYKNGKALISDEAVEAVKVCSVCKTEKRLSLFYKNKREKDGRQRVCSDCQKIRNREYQKKYRESEKYKERAREYQRAFRESEKGREYKRIYRKTDKYRSWVKNYNKSPTARKNKSNAKKLRSTGLYDSYVKHQINKQLGIPKSEITPELIELKRQLILSKRMIKEKQNEQKD